MAGLYIHIPFCRKACFYCNFHFSTRWEEMGRMADAILKEAALRKEEYPWPVWNTLYLGGGTPSIMGNEDLQRLIRGIRDLYAFDPGMEFTMEVNPDDMSMEKLRFWRSLGVNRLSIGIQSFSDEHLKPMNRAHNAKEAAECLKMAAEEGFVSLNIDLIYGFPGLSDQQWRSNLLTVFASGADHLSCYAMTRESGTPLDKMIISGKRQNISEEDAERHFRILREESMAHGWDHYEISNLSLPGKASRHNTSYWKGEPYLGLGPSAHSFTFNRRSWNVSDNQQYIDFIESGKLAGESEELTPRDRVNELVMTGLRLSRGLSVAGCEEIWPEWQKTHEKTIERLVQGELLIRSDEWLVLTEKGKFLADGIAAELFIVE